MPLKSRNLLTSCVGAVAAAILFAGQPAIGATEVRTDISMPYSLSGSYLAGRMAGSLRDAPAAARFYRRALSQDPGNPVLLERGFLLSLVAGDLDEAMPLARQVIALDSGNRVARLALSVKALRARQYGEVQRHLEESGNGPLAELTNALVGAWAKAGAGRLPEAMAMMETLQGPEWEEIFRPYFHSGLVAQLGGDAETAGEHFRRAYEADQRALRIVQAWARHLARQGRQQDALAVLDQFDEVLPEHPLIARMRDEISAGRTPAPLVTSPQEGVAEVLYGIGAALGTESGEEFSAIYLQLALHLAPRQPLALLSLANYFENVDDKARAIEVYERMPEDSALRRNADINRALALNDLDRTDEARALLEDLIDARPDDREALVAFGNILRSREMFDDARDYYAKAIDTVDPVEQRHWSLYYFRGITNERTDRWAYAERDFQKALELEPDQPYVLNYLGYSWVDQNVNLDEALQMIERAVELRPNDGYIVDSLGWAYYRLGEYQDAVRELERAVELRPQDPIINDHLGDAYWKVGRRIEARFQWSHARDLDPEPELLEEILKKIEDGLNDTEERSRAAADFGRDAD